MKKSLLLILTLVLAIFVMASCGGDKPCEAHVDGNRDFLCDECGAELPNNGLMLSEAVIAQLEATKSFSISATVNQIESEKSWQYIDGSPVQVIEYYETASNLEFTVSQADGAPITAHITLVAEDREAADDELKKSYTADVYIIGTQVYVYDEEMDAYVISAIDTAAVDQILATVTELTKGVSLDEAKKNELLTKLGDYAITTFNIVDNKGSVSIDLKEDASKLLKYLSELDMEKDTVEGVLDDALALVDPELTTAKLETELTRVMGLTTTAAIAEIDAWLTEKYNTTIQGIYDGAVADPTLSQIIKNAIRLSLEGTDVQDVNAEVEKIFNEQVKTFKIADAITEAQLGDVTLYELFVGYVMRADPAEAPDLATFMQSISQMLDMTLTEFETANETDVFSMLKYYGENTTVDALDAKVDLNFEGVFRLASVNAALNVGYTTTSDSEIEGKTDVETNSISITVNISKLSDSTVDIKVPTDKAIYYDLDYEYFYNYNSEFERVYFNIDSYGKVIIKLDVNVDDEYIYISSLPLEYDIFKSTTITVPASKLILEYYGDRNAYLDTESTKSLVINVDLASDSFTVTECPDYSLRYTAFEALYKIGTGEGVDNSDMFDLSADFGGYVQYINADYGSIYLTDAHLSFIQFSYVIDIDGNMLCTVTAIGVDHPKNLYLPDKSSTFYGSTDEELEAYLGGDTTFTISINADNVVVNDGLPDVVAEFIPPADN